MQIGDTEKTTPRTRFVRVKTTDEVSGVLSSESTQLLFLHDPWCPVSSNAEEELSAAGVTAMTVDVSTGRDLSRFIQQQTGIKHESPQVMVVSGGAVRWHASHYRITAESVKAALAAAASPS